jgi:thiamine pyrophosphate-dependent acetolactate synthase large subunit-like protein
MNGAEGLVRTAVAAGVDVCFANPGTTEMPSVARAMSVPVVRVDKAEKLLIELERSFAKPGPAFIELLL